MSTATIATILLLGVFLVLVFLRVPVVYAIGVASLLDFFYLGINPMQMALKFVSNLNSYTLLAVPFFILMGELMSAGGIHPPPVNPASKHACCTAATPDRIHPTQPRKAPPRVRPSTAQRRFP